MGFENSFLSEFSKLSNWGCIEFFFSEKTSLFKAFTKAFAGVASGAKRLAGGVDLLFKAAGIAGAVLLFIDLAADEVLIKKLISLFNLTLALVKTIIFPSLYELLFMKGFIPFHDPT